MTRILLDDGYRFGLGAFETIAIEEGKPVFLCQHLQRLEDTLLQLQIKHNGYEREKAAAKIRDLGAKCKWPRAAVKLIVSSGNMVYSLRENPYRHEMYEKGVSLKCSAVMRNETSPLTYLKTLNYGDHYLEKQKAKAEGYDEVIFLNSGGFLTEGAVSNLFCVKDNVIYTAPVHCGLLNGIMRQYVLDTKTVKETVISKEELFSFDEWFLTNSLMGIMPVKSIDEKQAKTMETGRELRKKYLDFLALLDKTETLRQNR